MGVGPGPAAVVPCLLRLAVPCSAWRAWHSPGSVWQAQPRALAWQPEHLAWASRDARVPSGKVWLGCAHHPSLGPLPLQPHQPACTRTQGSGLSWAAPLRTKALLQHHCKHKPCCSTTASTSLSAAQLQAQLLLQHNCKHRFCCSITASRSLAAALLQAQILLQHDCKQKPCCSTTGMRAHATWGGPCAGELACMSTCQATGQPEQACPCMCPRSPATALTGHKESR